jgi:hypothetical protein
VLMSAYGYCSAGSALSENSTHTARKQHGCPVISCVCVLCGGSREAALLR